MVFFFAPLDASKGYHLMFNYFEFSIVVNFLNHKMHLRVKIAAGGYGQKQFVGEDPDSGKRNVKPNWEI